MSSPKLPPEIMAALRTPATEPVDPATDEDQDTATDFTDSVSYETWHREQTWTIQEPPWA